MISKLPFLVTFGFPNLKSRALALFLAVLHVSSISWWSAPFSGAGRAVSFARMDPKVISAFFGAQRARGPSV